jgi:hypothetical protein
MEVSNTQVKIVDEGPEVLPEEPPVVVERPRAFKTMQPVKESTVACLTDWRPPKEGFILFEVPKVNLHKGGRKEITTGLLVMLIEHRPQQWMKLQDIILNKRGRLIHYANFPSLDHKDKVKRKRARMHTNADGVCDFDKMAQHCENAMNSQPASTALVNELRSQKDALQSEVDEFKRKFEELEAKYADQDKQDAAADKKGSEVLSKPGAEASVSAESGEQPGVQGSRAGDGDGGSKRKRGSSSRAGK